MTAKGSSVPSTFATRPHTQLADVAERMLAESSPRTLVNHCWRTYAFGAALLSQQGRDYDDEALFVASALHDLGFTDLWDDGITPFETRGAQVAHEALLEQGARPELAGLVRDAIALHLEISTPGDPRPEVAGVALGAAVDVLGMRLSDLSPAMVDEVLEAHPRLGFTTYVIDVLRSQAERKPTSRIAHHMVDLSFADLVAAAPFES
jgi:hypothetical protein